MNTLKSRYMNHVQDVYRIPAVELPTRPGIDVLTGMLEQAAAPLFQLAKRREQYEAAGRPKRLQRYAGSEDLYGESLDPVAEIARLEEHAVAALPLSYRLAQELAQRCNLDIEVADVGRVRQVFRTGCWLRRNM